MRYIQPLSLLVALMFGGFGFMLIYQVSLAQATVPFVPSAVDAGISHTCALSNNGAVKCWGLNASGQLGNQSQTNSSLPVLVVGLSGGVQTMVAGENFTCAILASNGSVKCWGENQDGQLGVGDTADRTVPVDVAGVVGSGLALGNNHTCAIVSTGAKCWGDNQYGQLGVDQPLGSTTPVNVGGLTGGVTRIGAGIQHTCALVNGGVQCWGRNDSGQLGNGTPDSSRHFQPTGVTGLTSGVIGLAVGDHHNCALLQSGAVRCWGRDIEGRVGDGQSSTTPRPTPVTVVGLTSGIATIGAGGRHSCAAQTSTGNGLCWGYNFFGQLGNNTETNANTPVTVSGLTTARQVTLGDNHTCALTDGPQLRCWGDNQFGQLGDGTLQKRAVPVVISLGDAPAPTATPTPPFTPTFTPTFTPIFTPTPTLSPTRTNTPFPFVTPTFTSTPITPATATPTPTPPLPPPSVTSIAKLYLSMLSNIDPPPTSQFPTETPTIQPTDTPAPTWRQIGRAPQGTLISTALVVQGNQLWVGAREQPGNVNGGLHRGDLTGCTEQTLERVNAGIGAARTILGVALQNGKGVAVAFSDKFFYSADNGANWSQTASPIVGDAQTVESVDGLTFYAGTQGGGIYQSNDSGQTWFSLVKPDTRVNRLRLHNDTLWFAISEGADAGVWTLPVNTAEAQPKNDGLDSPERREVWDFAFYGGFIYLATYDGVLYGDGNSAWQPLVRGLERIRLNSLEVVAERWLYAGAVDRGVWRRPLDGSSEWQQISTVNWRVRDLLYESTHCNGLLAATDDGVWLYR